MPIDNIITDNKYEICYFKYQSNFNFAPVNTFLLL